MDEVTPRTTISRTELLALLDEVSHQLSKSRKVSVAIKHGRPIVD